MHSGINVLEIGVDTGVTFISLIAFFARTKERFLAVGIDVKVQPSVILMMSNLDLVTEKQNAFMIEDNSLNVLPKLIEQDMKFDVVLLDGDHNYHTVSNELKLLDRLVPDHGIMIVDDYSGRWSERDLWYSERPGYQENQLTTQKIETEKAGVKPAVDDWLIDNPDWVMLKFMSGEPVVLTRKKNPFISEEVMEKYK